MGKTRSRRTIFRRNKSRKNKSRKNKSRRKTQKGGSCYLNLLDRLGLRSKHTDTKDSPVYSPINSNEVEDILRL